jgi:uncharacterized repeat protein (TIGR01451 family)
VDAGGTLLYTLVITNSGNGNATSVTVTEHYDPNVSFAYSNPSPDPGSGNRVWTLPPVVVGDPEAIDVVVDVTSPLARGTVLTNRAVLDSAQTAAITVTEVTSVTSAAELTVTKVDFPDPVDAGEQLGYVITYQNSGTASAEDVVITETYDSHVTFRSANPAPKGGTDNVWDIGDLAVGDSGNILVTVDVDTPLTDGTMLTNVVTMDSRYTAPQSVTETTRVRSAPALTLTVADSPDPVDAGDSLAYTLRYANAGNADATQVVVTATLDADVTFWRATPSPDGGSGRVWYWNVGAIPGEDGSGQIAIYATVPVSLPNNTILEFKAQLEDAEGDFLERPAQTTVRTLPDLTIGKVGEGWEEGHRPSLFSPGKQMAYVVTYGNAGYGDAQDVIITTTLPTGTTYVEVGYGWQPDGDGAYTYAVGSLPAGSTTRTITFTVVHTDTPGISAPEYFTPFTIAEDGGTVGDANPEDNIAYVTIGVPDLTVVDFTVEPVDPLPPNVPVTFTVVLTNQGTGMAWNPDTEGGFYVDVFTATVPSYPFVRYSEIYTVVYPLAPGAGKTIVLTYPGFSEEQIREQIQAFYVKADNYEPMGGTYLWGLVPEYDEMNNVAYVVPLTARFTATPTSGCEPLTVAFTNTSTGDYTESLWDFGDRVTSTLESLTHTYTVSGVYTVTLTISRPSGSDTVIRPRFITVTSPPPVQRVTFLPLIMRRWPPIPDTPVLNAISNADGDGNYTVSWSAADLADSYTLQEDDNSSFSSPTTAYTGSSTSWNEIGKATGMYYYRVRANNSWGNSGWSNVRSVTVESSCIPDPPGESDNIDDALTICSEQIVSGRVSDDDRDDVYQIAAAENQLLTISMSGSGGNADLYLYPPGTTDVNTDPFAAWSRNDGNDEFIQGTVLEGGFWYIDVFSFEGTTRYKLTATLSEAGASETSNFSIQTGQVRDRHQGRVPPRYFR